MRYPCRLIKPMDYENELEDLQRPVIKQSSKTNKDQKTAVQTNDYKNKLRSSWFLKFHFLSRTRKKEYLIFTLNKALLYRICVKPTCRTSDFSKFFKNSSNLYFKNFQWLLFNEIEKNPEGTENGLLITIFVVLMKSLRHAWWSPSIQKLCKSLFLPTSSWLPCTVRLVMQTPSVPVLSSVK